MSATRTRLVEFVARAGKNKKKWELFYPFLRPMAISIDILDKTRFKGKSLNKSSRMRSAGNETAAHFHRHSRQRGKAEMNQVGPHDTKLSRQLAETALTHLTEKTAAGTNPQFILQKAVGLMAVQAPSRKTWEARNG